MDINFDKNEKDKNEERNRYIAMTGSQENRYRIIENENNQNSEFSENFFVHKKNREASDDIDKRRNEAVAKNGYFNTKIREAQSDYDKKMNSRPTMKISETVNSMEVDADSNINQINKASENNHIQTEKATDSKQHQKKKMEFNSILRDKKYIARGKNVYEFDLTDERNALTVSNWTEKQKRELENEEKQVVAGGYVRESKIKGLLTERFAQTTERNIRAITTSAYMTLPKSNDVVKGGKITYIVTGIAVAMPMTVISRNANRNLKYQYRKYLMYRNDENYLKRRQDYNQQLIEVRNGTRESISNSVKPTKLEDAIFRGNFKEIRIYEIQDINRILRKNGYATIPTNLPSAEVANFCRDNLNKIKIKEKKAGDKYAVAPQEVVDALERGIKLGRAYDFEKRDIRGRKRPSRRALMIRQEFHMMMLRSGDVGSGLYLSSEIIQKTRRLVRGQVRAIQGGNKIIRKANQRMMVDAIKKLQNEANNLRNKANYLDAAQTKYNKNAESLRKRADNKERKANQKQKKQDKRNNKQKKKDKRRERKRNRIDYNKSAINARWQNSMLGKMKNNLDVKLQGSKLGKAMDKVSNILGRIAEGFSSLKKHILIAIGSFLGVYLILLLIILIFQVICMALNFANADNKTIITDYIEQLYIDDLTYIVYKYEGSGYTLSFEDIRDNDAYELHTTSDGSENDNDVWFQSTNGAEICCMTYLNFNYDLESYKIDDLKSYVASLYYGSHEITGTSYGNGGEIVFKTWYFNSLFTREKGTGTPYENELNGIIPNWSNDRYHSLDTVSHPDSVGMGDTESAVFNTLTTEYGYSKMSACAVMGNIYGESGFNAMRIGSNGAYGLYQFDPGSSGNYNNPSPGSVAYNYKQWLQTNNLSDSATTQTEFVQASLQAAFASYTGKSKLYSYSSGEITDETQYHVWVKHSYSFDDFKSWSPDSYLAYELVADFRTHGDTSMGSASAVSEYLDSLSTEDKAVAYATLLFTRTFERPSSKDWIGRRVKKAVEYYHRVGGFSGEARTSLTYDEVANNPCYTGHNGGVNPFTGSIGLDKYHGDRGGNCTAYAWGRRCEMEGGTTYLGSSGNANTWYTRESTLGVYKTGTDGVQVGAIVCWGYTDNPSGSPGHVAVVESIDADGTITTSNSAYGSHTGIPNLFYTETFTSEQDLKTHHNSSFYRFNGYIFIEKKEPLLGSE